MTRIMNSRPSRPFIYLSLAVVFLLGWFGSSFLNPTQTRSANWEGQVSDVSYQGENSKEKDADSTKEPTKETAAEPESDSESSVAAEIDYYPLVCLAVGILIVLGLIIGFKINAFIALITAAIVVSLMAGGDIGSKISRVADAFGSSAGGIAIVIALAAVIGKCMLDSGAADRIVRAFLSLLGEKKSPIALMGSGFVLAVPVFFDTVFYLLVPLARSLHRKTGVQYLTYILAIGAGGAITHTLVPPTPGPLLMADNLGIDVGLMMLIGAAVALPAAIAGSIFGRIADALMKTPMRDLPGAPDPEPVPDEKLPSLLIALAPVLLPVVMISASTVATTLADAERAAQAKSGDVNWPQLAAALKADVESEGPSVGKQIANHPAFSNLRAELLSGSGSDDSLLEPMNELLRDKGFYDEDAFLGTKISSVIGKLIKSRTREKLGDTEHINRQLLEAKYDESVIKRHEWNTQKRQASNFFKLFGNANLALLLSAIIALVTLVRQRGLTLKEMGVTVEEALMSGGVIILITAAGGAFGAMLQKAEISEAIQALFSGTKDANGAVSYLLLGFVIAGVLKIAQGSSTVAMIVGSSMMAAIVGGADIGCHPVYLATAIGGGSLFGSWMNDSGFWIFAKMGVLTEGEALKSWTVMLVILSLVTLGMSILLATVYPMV